MSQTTPRAIAFKITAIVLLAYFVFAAVVYYNDPEPVHWMLFYFVCALCCLLTVLRKDSLGLLYIAMGMGVIEMASTADALVAVLRETSESVNSKPFAVLRRDFFGAAISIMVCACLAVRLRRAAR